MKKKGKEEPKEPEIEKELQELREKVEALQAEKEDIFGKLQRVSADYANFQKRVAKQISDSVAYEKEKIIKTMLPAFDNFEHMLQNANRAENVDVLLAGVRIIYDQMLDILKSHDVEQISAMGEKFDPAIHLAMMQQNKPDKEDNVVLEEFQKGYTLNGRVLRASRVVVNKLPAEPAAADKQGVQEASEEKADSQQGPAEEPETTDTE